MSLVRNEINLSILLFIIGIIAHTMSFILFDDSVFLNFYILRIICVVLFFVGMVIVFINTKENCKSNLDFGFTLLYTSYMYLVARLIKLLIDWRQNTF